MQVCAAYKLPRQRWRPQRVCIPGVGGVRGQKSRGVLRGVMVSVAGVSMGGVYPEKEAGPQGPAGVRMSRRQGHLQRRLRWVGQARAGSVEGGRGPLCPWVRRVQAT